MDDQTDTVNTTEQRGRKHLKPMHGTRICTKVKESAGGMMTFRQQMLRKDWHSLEISLSRTIRVKQVLYITVGATVESSVPLHYVHLSFSDDWFDNRK